MVFKALLTSLARVTVPKTPHERAGSWSNLLAGSRAAGGFIALSLQVSKLRLKAVMACLPDRLTRQPPESPRLAAPPRRLRRRPPLFRTMQHLRRRAPGRPEQQTGAGARSHGALRTVLHSRVPLSNTRCLACRRTVAGTRRLRSRLLTGSRGHGLRRPEGWPVCFHRRAVSRRGDGPAPCSLLSGHSGRFQFLFFFP